jgi:phage-related baseplate assembly protein
MIFWREILSLPTHLILKVNLLLNCSKHSPIAFTQTGQINAKAKALMLAYAKGSDLDHLAANRDVYRKTIIPAQPNANPPIDAVMESDEDLRRRTHLQPESMSAGSGRISILGT